MFKNLSKKPIILLLSGLAVLTAIGTFAYYSGSNRLAENSNKQASNPDAINVVVSVYPVYNLATQIGGDKINLTQIQNSGDAHTFEPGTADIAKIQDADLFIYNGAGLESWAEKLIENPDFKTPVLNLSENVELLAAEEHSDSEKDEDESHEGEDEGNHSDDMDSETDEEHSDSEKENKKGENHSEEEHGHGDEDPHFWLDPVIYAQLSEQVEDKLVQLDLQNREFYQQNGANLRSQLTALNQDYQVKLASCQQSTAVISHEALNYLAKRYNFETKNIAGLDSQTETSTTELIEIIDFIRANQITAILVEESLNGSNAETILQETGVAQLTFNSLENSPENDENYVSLMQQNLETLQEALQCT